MDASEDRALLAQYAREGSEEAFAALVARHLNLVYSVALRHVTDPQEAEDIAQVVFLILAKKAKGLSPNVVLAGWLYRTARLTAANCVRTAIRRQRREQEALLQSFPGAPTPDPWPQIALHLDEAMGYLGDRERDAVVLRFFEGRSFQEVGEALGAAEGTAQKCVERALKKLRSFFNRRGIALSMVTLASALTAHSASAAPVGLASTIGAAASLSGTSVGRSTLALLHSTLKTMGWLKVQAATMVGATALLVVGTTAAAVTGFRHAHSAPAPAVMFRASLLDKRDNAESSVAQASDGAWDDAPAPTASEPAVAPDDAHSYLRHGRFHLDHQEYDAAIADFDQALQIDPRLAAAHFQRARVHKLKGEYAAALADYDQTLALHPNSLAAHINRGQVHKLIGDCDAAIADYDWVLALRPRNAIARLDRGAAHAAKGDYAEAAADFRESARLQVDRAAAYHNLAWLEATCPEGAFRDGQDAVSNALRACALTHWSNPNQLDTLAAAYAEAGDFPGAVHWESRVLADPQLSSPDQAIARERLALYQAGQPYHRVLTPLFTPPTKIHP
jgi:RNA polymerase sigma factor (sigma-70 family)